MNLQILYEKYCEFCAEQTPQIEPAKICVYRKVFNHEYNIEFQKLKKDRCDTCEAAKFDNSNKEKYSHHLASKTETHNERLNDRANKATNYVMCYDMQNVFALPTANVSNFFYKRKLNVYHLTGHFSHSKQSYGVLWGENLSGRTGNDIASGLIKILERLIEDRPEIRDLILWSDSCVPQNRNKVMSYALMLFLRNNTGLSSIVQKYCEPGHSEIQEADNLHSQLESVMENTEVCSPVSLVRVLSKAPRKKPIKLIQLKKSDMMDYHSEANRFRFDGVPYTKVKCLRYSADSPMDIEYKVRFSDKEWAKESLQLMVSLRKLNSGNDMEMKTPKQITTKKFLSKEKIKDIESMLPFMPANDRLYMELMCKTTSTSEERAPEASAAKPSKAAAAPKFSKSGEERPPEASAAKPSKAAAAPKSSKSGKERAPEASAAKPSKAATAPKSSKSGKERAPEASAAKPSKAAAAPKSSKSGKERAPETSAAKPSKAAAAPKSSKSALAPTLLARKRNEAPQFCKFTSVRILCNVNFFKNYFAELQR